MHISRKILLSAALATVLSPLPTVAFAPATQAADQPAVAAPNEHHVVAVKLVGRGDYPAGTTDASMLDKIDRALDRWEVEAAGALDFVRPTKVVALASQESCNQSTALREQAEAMFPSMDFGGDSGDHLVLMMPASCRTKDAVGSLGSAGLRSGGYVVGGYLEDSDQVSTWAHEFGHNLGLSHAHGRTCAASDCGIYAYGDRYSVMGVGVTGAGYGIRALSSFERLRLGLADGAEVRALGLEAGRRVRTFEVAVRGRGTAEGLRGVQVVDPVDDSVYHLDFRNGLGLDGTAYLNGAGAHDGSYYYNKGVTVQKVSTDTDGNPVTVLQAFDWAPTGGWHYALTAGETYASAAGGMQVEVTGMQLTGSPEDVATLRVTLTDPSVPLGTQTGTIAITEHGAVGSTVTATTAGFQDAVLGDVQWYDDGVAIAGAVGPRFTIPAGMDGHRLTATVTGTRESYRDLTATSNTLVVGKDLLVDGATYQIRSTATGRLVSADGPRTSLDNVQAVVVDPSSTSATRWTVAEVAPGVYRLRATGTSKCLDDERARTAPDKPIIVWSCTSNDNQRWTLAGSGQGYALVNQTSKLALTPQADDRLVQSTGSYGWELVPVS